MTNIVVTMGDPAGVGPEIVCKALADKKRTAGCQFLVIGAPAALARAMKAVKVKLDVPEVDEPSFPGRLQIWAPYPWDGPLPSWGAWTPKTGAFSLEWVEAAAKLLVDKRADALVTAPICKEAWAEAGGKFPGHTELLGHSCGRNDELMLLVGGGLRVALVTVHEPLAKVARLVTRDKIVHDAMILHRELPARLGVKNPRIAILGLNPHAGEGGKIGGEEKAEIVPAVRQLTRQGVKAEGPVPADTAFHRMLAGDYDVILAMYHDQGLAPLKTVAFDSGVNITLGLPIIRTSPDHGTAFDIAGKGKADAKSFLEAIACAKQMAERAAAAKK